jgi:RNA polymerase sigma-70 factor (ECF subfamily)
LAVEVDVSSRLLERGLLAATSSPSQQAARREQAVILAEVLGQLPDDHREVIILRHLEGMTFPEVAARLDKSTDSVKKLWARALARLRGLLGEMP